jgi:hypothetical protein
MSVRDAIVVSVVLVSVWTVLLVKTQRRPIGVAFWDAALRFGLPTLAVALLAVALSPDQAQPAVLAVALLFVTFVVGNRAWSARLGRRRQP